jgi:tetratricopeptide (TPR) repeat protein
MKKLFAILFILLGIAPSLLHARAINADSLTRKQFIKSKTVYADSLNSQALQLAVADAGPKELNEAINLIMKGLHIYSRYRDSTGLRQTFDHLSMVYRLQKKHIQAKWFAIQANSMARDMRDTLNIVQTLLNLSAIKTDIKDYDLAKRDLNEALQMAKQQARVGLQIDVQKGIVSFYTSKGDVKKSASAMDRILVLKDSVANGEENRKLVAFKKQYHQMQFKQQLLVQQKQNALRIESVQLKKIVDQKNAVAVITLAVTALIVFALAIFYLKRKRRRRRKRRQ